MTIDSYEYKYEYEIGQIIKDDKKDFTIIDRFIFITKYNQKIRKYKIKCNKCGFDSSEYYRAGKKYEEYSLIQNDLKSMKECPCCGRCKFVVVVGINDITTTNPEMIENFQGGFEEAKKYSSKSNCKIIPKCAICGNIKNKYVQINDIERNDGISCECCGVGKSYPEKVIFNILKQLNIDFIDEYKPEWCIYEDNGFYKKGRYDFYIPSMNLIIETDGKQHRKEEILKIDKIKNNLANKNGINIIRIECDKSYLYYIKNNIINSNLSNYFDLSLINWDKCEKIYLNSVLKNICLYRENNPFIQIKELADIFYVHKDTVARYLKIGNKLGLCNYNPEEESKKYRFKNGNGAKQVEVFKNNTSLGRFNSVIELVEKSLELFEVQFLPYQISNVCL